jgi:uncharacterized protein (DUF486 family)
MPLPPALTPIAVLFVSNVFMTFAWYGHLRYKTAPLALAILASWGIAFFEYCLAVPANRWGSAVYSPVELKTIQEVVTLTVFAGFSGALPRRGVPLEPRGRLCADRRRRLLRVSEMVIFKFPHPFC